MIVMPPQIGTSNQIKIKKYFIENENLKTLGGT